MADYKATHGSGYWAKTAIIDFYADWCGPKMIAPILEELADEYSEDIVIYKVDTETEQERRRRSASVPSLDPSSR